MIPYHIPVMASESIVGMNIRPGSDIVDVTFGGGGHGKLILDKLITGRLFAFDQDMDSTTNLPDDKRLFFIRHNFRYIRNFLHYYGVDSVDAIFGDLGLSSHDIDIPERGFSHRYNGALDMRMNQNAKTDAAFIVNHYSEEQLTRIFKMYGEIFNAGRLASEIIKKRGISPVNSTAKLKEIALLCSPKAIENKYLSQVFQALRIEVNDEMEALKEFLAASKELLKPGGRLVIITYHSLEDRLCKNFMKTGNFDGLVEKDFFGNVLSPFRMISRKPITPGSEELKNNNRSRSAKLRIAEKI